MNVRFLYICYFWIGCLPLLQAQDITPPSASCAPITATLHPVSGEATITPNQIDNGSTDDTGISQLLINGQSSYTYTGGQIGANVAILEVIDLAGNSSTCSAAVDIQDITAPSSICVGSLTVFLNALGHATVTPDQIDHGSIDNTSISQLFINGLNSYTYTATQIGANLATLEVIDLAGNSSACSAIVEVQDSISPVAICKNITLMLDASGQITVLPDQINGGSHDNLGILELLINGQSSHTYNCNDLGNQMATLTVIDIAGNQSSCVAMITVVDNITPNIICQNITAYLGSNGQVVVPAAALENGSTDNCGIANLLINGQSDYTYTCQDIGIQFATITAQDPSGNMSSCNAVIEVIDTNNAPLTCQTFSTFAINQLGYVQITPNDVIANGTAGSVCGSAILSIDGSNTLTYDCQDVGIHIVTVEATSLNGNAESCTAIVQIEDQENPNATCQSPISVYLDNNGSATLTPNQVDGGSTDNCGITETLLNGLNTVDFDANDVGIHAVLFSAIDDSGNEGVCASLIYVEDTIAPVAVCQTSITANLDANSGTVDIPAISLDNGSTDNTAIDYYTISQETFDCSQTGTNTVTLTVVDISGNSASCTSEITILDITPPVVGCQNASIYLDAGMNYADVFVQDIILFNSTTDNCGIQGYTLNQNTIDCSALGGTSITATVVDFSGNTSTCTATVTLIDTLTPITNCQDITVELDASGNYTLDAQELDLSGFDECNGLSYTINGNAQIDLTCSELGTNTYTLTLTDASGNSASCQSTVELLDPFNTCPLSLRPVFTQAVPCDQQSCLGVATLEPFGGLAPYNYAWSDGVSGPNMNYRQNLCSQVYSVTITDANGYAIEDSIHIGFEQGCVWPGDTDDNAAVNNMDLLPISLMFGDLGNTRPNPTINWEGQAALNWNVPTGINNIPDPKHIDSNGDGAINQQDIGAIQQNYGHDYIRSSAPYQMKVGDIPIKVGTITTVQGQRLALPIYLGDATNIVEDAYAIAFTISYDPEVVEANSVSVDIENDSWLGQNGQLIHLQQNFEGRASIEVAVGRINQNAVTGFGQIGKMYITITDDVLRGSNINLVESPINISNVRLIGRWGEEIGTMPQQGILTVEGTTGTNALQEQGFHSAVTPNPASDQFNIEIAGAELQHWRLYAATGQLVREDARPDRYTNKVHVADLPTGVYTLELITNKGNKQQKITIK